ncbi:helix-hairpin-helix domain-containing protein [Maribellus maritimus]|uniref:helix-hairpin-helix domain-containing protein n=1 Tax=Maribellus maritimus TaxID=2870838 RepID=UPI001EEC94B9|nr:helix-hairpin-helix domain-containing protein [Maribellus maritimus]MCG6186113.1 helix-hairpin-helix domain-containing protein [Maribellus maritimus]
MKWGREHIIAFALLLFAIGLSAQETDPVRTIEAILESLAGTLEEESGAALIIEDLERLAENPLNINSASVSELSRLHFLNDIQIQNLIHYREQYGAVYSIYELNTIEGFSPDLLLKMEPFVSFGNFEEEPQRFSETLKYGRHQLLIRTLTTIQIPKGYKKRDDGSIPYEGNRFRYYSRYRFEAGDNFSVGFTAEKDPGEAFFLGSNRSGFDFYSGHISTKISSVIENVTVGDFWIRSGQGLVLWQGFSMNKSLNALDISKTNQGVRPFTSTDENKFFRGLATSLKFEDLGLIFFYSHKNDDANIIFTDSVPTSFSSLQTSGYHRTENETADEKSLENLNWGAIVTWQFNYLKLGATFVAEQFGLSFVRSDQLYNKFRFSGSKNYTAGTDYLFSRGKYQLFGEAAISKSKGKAFLQGAVAHWHDRFSLSLLFRHFDKDYHALWANPFAEGGSAENETGLYLGTRILPVKYVTLSAYTDFYHSEWVNYTTAGPASGWEVFAQADFRFSEKFQFYLRYKNEEKDQKVKLDKLYQNKIEQNRKIRLHLQYKPGEKLTYKTRFEHSFFEGLEKEKGFLMFQDIQYSSVSFPLNCSVRLAWFSTGGYNSRIYAYENDLLYTFSVPAFYDKGFRGYLNLKYQISEKLDCWFKIGHTIYNERESISSGYNEIAGNQKTELKFQLRLKI